MTSSVPLQIIDDDEDEFDWEAAVKEIDVACQNAHTSILLPNNPFPPFAPSVNYKSNNNNYTLVADNDFSTFDNNKKRGSCSRQSTLDKFIGKAGPRPQQGNWIVEDCEPQAQKGVDRDVPASCIKIDAEAAKTWIYPVNIPLRDYQFAITKTALFSNTLVALPTGLGKTLIAAVVMYNYFRWFPDGKIVFAAPSRPLVMQQIEACHNIAGIPQEWTIDMTGQISPAKRACFWKTKRVFFVTPQVLEKDIQAGTCLVRYLVCLVIDEAHRASGNYSYCVAVRELMAVPVHLRILALTATPGSKQPAIQHIIDNLCISTLEYRNESDPDVSPYVHNRKIELIEVALGKDAVDINKRLLDVIRPYAARLSTFGLLQNRDYQTLSPPDLLNSRDKFRRAPPAELPQNKYGEIEAYFGGLITLYHIRKLLSSHGIRPAYEMLEEKLKQGSFARLMSKNEDIRRVKLLMEQSLSHGAPSPKLSKMLEILVDHFKAKDPQNSRVIIFSNFRGSVRDIMNALAKIGDLVKATEFIGQSSGKALKGQSQKVQQAVLQKFRAGGFNVIVATSIGEEGLDIMEVDLVICFDANVSPLRMIQRMGRTGRKHDGRVVVLACEGSELKGYMRKQASNRAVRKHMHNGGINSFTFHSSPRMIPHIFKPEVQFVEMAIEKYVPRGKKVKDDNAVQTPVFQEKLNDMEIALIVKYFQPTGENTWRPSLISFPHFQAFPSRVHKVMHSYRTDMLIDMMQHLQCPTFSGDNRALSIEDDVSSSKCLRVDTIKKEDADKEDSLNKPDCTNINSQLKVTDCDGSPVRNLKIKKHDVLVLNSHDSPVHSYIFGSDFVSVDALGKVSILSVPIFPLQEEESHSKSSSADAAVPSNCFKQNYGNMKISSEGQKEQSLKEYAGSDLTNFQTPCKTNAATARFSSTKAWEDKTLDWAEKIPRTPIFMRNLTNDRDCVCVDLLGTKAPSPQADEFGYNIRDAELSPRLTNMIQSGIVPESPVHDSGLKDNEGRNDFLVPDLVSPVKLKTELLPRSGSLRKIVTTLDSSACENSSDCPINNEIRTPRPMVNDFGRTIGCMSFSPVAGETNTPLASLTKSSSSNDWLLSSGSKSENVEQVCKLKRLRKIGDIVKHSNQKRVKKNSLVPTVANFERSSLGSGHYQVKHGGGQIKHVGDVRLYLEEEAEVSSEAEISDDEEDEGNNTYDDSFIDDRINPTEASTQAETNGIDMMAVYRRSLLSQSPIERELSSAAAFTPDCQPSLGKMIGSGSSTIKTFHSLQTTQTDSASHSAVRDSDSMQMKTKRIPAMPCAIIDLERESEMNLESRKRKLTFCQSGPIPAINLEREFFMQSEATKTEPFHLGPSEKFDVNSEIFYDQFFDDVDLDAVEAQAALLLKGKTELPVKEQDTVLKSNSQNLELHNSPSFDLGIW